MHGTVIGAEPVDQHLDVELCHFAACRMSAIDVHSFASGQGVGEGFGHGELH